MLLLTTAAHPTILQWRERPNGHALGRLVTPRHYPRHAETAAAGIPWAADNDGFTGVDFPAFERMIEDLARAWYPSVPPGLRFVTAPDVWPDADATMLLWDEWAPVLGRWSLPAALVLQDGLTVDGVPWGSIDALFIGGTDEYKLGAEVRAIVARANAYHRPIWVHMGRVNSIRRIAYAAQIGCDSVDGSKYSRWRDTRLPDGLLATVNAGINRPTAFELDGT